MLRRKSGQNMTTITLRWMNRTELDRLTEIDRSEMVRTGYEMRDGDLAPYSVEWNVPSFLPDDEGDHSIAAQIRFCRSHLDRGGRMLGAFDGEKLVGVGIITPEIRPALAQLSYLHVSAGYRRAGIAGRIVRTLIAWAADRGAQQIYVSATPSESAINFYLALGFSPTNEPVPELFELEPDDIHMIKNL
jgi:GNAT superfamily N-acetyltransferase